jgi:hypothetical protein
MARKPKKSTKKVASKRATTNGNGKVHGRVIRVASVVNPTTKKNVLVGATLDGKISDPRIAKRLKITRALSSWREIEAETWAAATAAFRSGKGVVVTSK